MFLFPFSFVSFSFLLRVRFVYILIVSFCFVSCCFVSLRLFRFVLLFSLPTVSFHFVSFRLLFRGHVKAPSLVRAVLQHGARVNTPRGDRRIPLHTAMRLPPGQNKLSIVGTLLVVGADINRPGDEFFFF